MLTGVEEDQSTQNEGDHIQRGEVHDVDEASMNPTTLAGTVV